MNQSNSIGFVVKLIFISAFQKRSWLKMFMQPLCYAFSNFMYLCYVKCSGVMNFIDIIFIYLSIAAIMK